MPALLALAALTIGYILGRARLGHRASDWAHWLMYGRRLTRRDWQWWAAQPVFAVEIAAILITHPQRTIHNWRHRNDPPPPLGPPLRIRDTRGEATP